MAMSDIGTGRGIVLGGRVVFLRFEGSGVRPKALGVSTSAEVRCSTWHTPVRASDGVSFGTARCIRSGQVVTAHCVRSGQVVTAL